jgi:hypothetical protein
MPPTHNPQDFIGYVRLPNIEFITGFVTGVFSSIIYNAIFTPRKIIHGNVVLL